MNGVGFYRNDAKVAIHTILICGSVLRRGDCVSFQNTMKKTFNTSHDLM